MFYWHSGLYVMIEGFKELGPRDEKIETLLESPNVETHEHTGDFKEW